jgi:hypothetical protein
LEHWCQAFTFIAVSPSTRYRIRRIERNHRFGKKSKECFKKTLHKLLVPGNRFGAVLANPCLCLKIIFIQKVKSGLQTSVAKEGTANDKDKEYCSLCTVRTLLLRASSRVGHT